MKYALLVEFGAKASNFGDYVQSIAIEYLYELMSIPKSEIVYIKTSDISSYRGEPLLLPYNYVMHLFVFPTYTNVKLSPDVIPVFLGGSLSFTQFGDRYPVKNLADSSTGWIDMFRKYSPIGCRDHFTRNFIASLGIETYLQSCITNIFPCRKNKHYNKTLLIDCTTDILPYLPNDILNNVEVITQYESNDGLSIEENYQRIKERYEYYRDTASLVITSRYHVATPCNAMGIPTIFINRQNNYYSEDIRIDALNPNIQLVSCDEYEHIDWHPKWNDFPDLKKQITDLAIARIREAYVRNTVQKPIADFFAPRIAEYEKIRLLKNPYQERLCAFVRENYSQQAKGKFFIWGAIQLLCDGTEVALADLVNTVNPNMEFVGWIDTFKSGMLAGKPIVKPNEFVLTNNDFVIIAAETAVSYAKKRFNEMNVDTSHFFIVSNTMIEQSDIDNALHS